MSTAENVCVCVSDRENERPSTSYPLTPANNIDR